MMHRIKYIHTLLSLVLLSVMIFITTVVLFCPMAMHMDTLALDTSPHLCQLTESVTLNTGGIAGCLGVHLAVFGQLLGDVPHSMSMLFLFILSLSVYYFSFRNFLATFLQPLVSRLRHYHIYYQTAIKVFIEKKILRFLGHLGHYTVVSSF